MALTSSKGELIRSKIIEQSIRIISKNGFDGTSFQMIADACGLKQTAVLYHFSSRDDLIHAIILAIIENNHALVDNPSKKSGNKISQITDYFRANLKWAMDYPDQAQVVILLYYYGCFNPKFSALYRSIQENARKRILNILTASKSHTNKSRPTDLAALLHDLLLGGIINTLAGGNSKKESQRLNLRWKLELNAILKDIE